MELKPGRLVALVGSSGSGKSTLVGLLQRLYDATDGQACGPLPTPPPPSAAKRSPSYSLAALLCFALLCFALLCFALLCFALLCFALCFALPCLALPCLALPCLALPCLALPCLALPCLALPCLALPVECMTVQILADGVDITAIDAAQFRRQLGVVSQDPHLLSLTIADNILYGLEDEGIQLDDVEDAARMVLPTPSAATTPACNNTFPWPHCSRTCLTAWPRTSV